MSNNKVVNAIKSVATKNKIKIDFGNLQKDLKSLKIDSLAAMNLIMQVEEELNVTLDDEKLISIKTLEDLVKAFEEKLK